MLHRSIAPARTYTIDALLSEGFTHRMIRHYITRGILPHAIGRGRGAYYTDLHIRILREIREARDTRRTIYDVGDWAHDTFPHAFPES